MLELSKRNFKMIPITILKDLTKNVYNINDKMNNFS